LHPAVEAYYRSLGVSLRELERIGRYGGAPQALQRERHR